VNELLNHRSGLAGLSGVSGDMRDIESAADSGNARAALALEMFAYRARKYIGAYAAALGGVDAIAYAGGIGEHSAQTRRRICLGLEFFGIFSDGQRNSSARAGMPSPIHAESSDVQVWIIPTDEERQIAREVCQLLRLDN
jgi:acetate kinase